MPKKRVKRLTMMYWYCLFHLLSKHHCTIPCMLSSSMFVWKVQKGLWRHSTMVWPPYFVNIVTKLYVTKIWRQQIWSVEEIFVVDYGRYELVVLYCDWVVANTVGQIVTMKQDDYGFSFVKFSKLVSLSAKSFEFSLNIEHIWMEGGSSGKTKGIKSCFRWRFHAGSSMAMFRQCWKTWWISTTIFGQWCKNQLIQS